MAGIVNFAKTGVLTINGFSCNNARVDIPDLSPLWHTRAWVGDNAQLVGVDGRVPGRRRLDELSVVLAGIIVGHADAAGTPIADAAAGMDLNQDAMRAALVDPMLVDGDESVPATLLRPGGSTDSFECQCDLRFGPIVGSGSAWKMSRATFALRLVIPAGTPGALGS